MKLLLRLSAVLSRLGRSGGPDEAVGQTSSTQNATTRGLEFLKQGRFHEARDAFENSLRRNPDSKVHVNLAFVLQQLGEREAANEQLTRAVELAPESFDAQYMLGIRLEEVGKLHEAINAFSAAASINHGFVQVHADLCRVQSLAGNTAAAHDSIDLALSLCPTDASFHFFKGNVYLAEQNLSAAINSYDAALALQPTHLQAWINRGIAKHRGSQLAEAEISMNGALALSPDSGEANLRLGQILRATGRLLPAREALMKAASAWPNSVDVLNELGITSQELGKLDDAIAVFRSAISLAPKLPDAHANLGLALFEHGDMDGALSAYRHGLALGGTSELHDNYAIALQAVGSIDDAIKHYRLALQIRPDNLNTRCNLAAALSENGQAIEAIEAYRHIIRDSPAHAVAHSNLLFNLSVNATTTPEEYLQQAKLYNDALKGLTPLPGLDPSRREGLALRVGFVSGDMRDHPVGYFLEGVLPGLRRAGVELLGYPTVSRTDELTDRIRASFTTWRPLRGMTDREAAIAIREDRPDILIDLSGHTGHNRLPIFGFRAAPIQASWLGFFASTGLAQMDYLLADAISVPLGHEKDFSEKVFRLPETRLCFTPPTAASQASVGPLPLLANGFVTFGSFHRPSKLTDSVLRLWGRVLARLPGARLYIQNQMTGRVAYKARLRDRLLANGIDPNRVDMCPPGPRGAYLKCYEKVDIVLDAFPYTGGTTTCEALWMGVPTLTLSGESMISRQGAALMTAAGLPEWVAGSAQTFVERACALAGDAEGLRALRLTARVRLASSALFDVDRFAANLHAAFEEMWRTYRRSGEA